MQVLIPMRADSPDSTRSAIEAAVRLARQEKDGFRVHLLSVQPQVSSHVSMFFPKGELESLQQQAGRDELAVARSLLEEARVPYTESVRVGRSAETIARAAQEFRCEHVLMAEQGSTGMVEAVFGSLAAQVRGILSHSGNCKVITT